MKKVTKIDKVQNVTNKKQKLRVAAYCRVSTSNDAQLESLETQKAHYESYITSRDDWQFAGLYFDEHAIIGTSGENLVKSRVSALVPFNFFVKGKYNFI